MPAPRPFLATHLELLTRALLLSLRLDHALIDFLALTAFGAATVLLAIFVVAIRVPRRQSALSIPRIPQ